MTIIRNQVRGTDFTGDRLLEMELTKALSEAERFRRQNNARREGRMSSRLI